MITIKYYSKVLPYKNILIDTGKSEDVTKKYKFQTDLLNMNAGVSEFEAL